jgi:D-3-phosphoglycerate dehydrogenase
MSFPKPSSTGTESSQVARFKILITGVFFLRHIARQVDELADIADVIIELEPSRKELLKLVGDVDAIMLDMVPVDANLLESAPRLKAIIEYGVGTDHIDCKTAASRGIVVSNAPEAFSTDVAEHAIALLLALTRQVTVANNDVRHKFQWDTYGPVYTPTRLRGKTLGIVGIGRIGQETARIAAGIGMNVLAYDPFVNNKMFSGPPGVNIHFCPNLDSLLTQADAVSLHIPLTTDSAGMISCKEIQQMKPGAFLINVSRGPLIDQVALQDALTSGHLGGAGLDVMSPEPPKWDDPILSDRNLVLTPHIGWKSDQSILEVERDAVAEVRRILLGDTPKFQVNSN